MNKSQELKTTTDIVREVLKAHEQARNCDDYLYFLVSYLSNIEKIMDLRRFSSLPSSIRLTSLR